MFVCEPAPMYVFGTGVKMEPTTTWQSLRQCFNMSCDIVPDVGNPYKSHLFKRPLNVHTWSKELLDSLAEKQEQTSEANIKGKSLSIDERTPEVISSTSFFARSQSLYYGPGHAMMVMVLDLTRPPST